MKRFAQFSLTLALITSGIAAGVLSGCVSEQKISHGEVRLAQEPVLDPRLAREDFAFPSRPPRLSLGQVQFKQNCASCHQMSSSNYNKIRAERPIDEYLLLTDGSADGITLTNPKQPHPVFKNLTRDERWEALFYYRYVSGDGDIKNKDVAAVFGSNCAVCHGAKGQADGPLYTGHASAHELGMAPVKGDFDPPPANFHSYSRMYNRTNDQDVKYIEQGIYPSAMPSWLGRSDKDKNIAFDESLITDLVKYVRAFSYENDLPVDDSAGASPSGGAGAKSPSAPATGQEKKK